MRYGDLAFSRNASADPDFELGGGGGVVLLAPPSAFLPSVTFVFFNPKKGKGSDPPSCKVNHLQTRVCLIKEAKSFGAT